MRRLKTDVELSLPPKKEVLVYAPLTQKQETFYKAALDRTLLDILGDKKVSTPPILHTRFNRKPASEILTVGCKAAVFHLFMKLRPDMSCHI